MQSQAFCVDRLLDLAERDVEPAGNSVRAIVWEKASTSALATWRGIEDTYKGWYGIQPSWVRIRQLTEARNAIAHGLGNLTRAQRRSRASSAGKIVSAGIMLNGDRVILEDVNLESALLACVDLISEIDGLVQVKTGDPE